MRRERCLATIVATCAIAATARAEAPAWVVSTPNSANTNSGLHGTGFSPLTDIQVTALGWYDDTFASAPGLTVEHEVGIFEAGSQKLVAYGVVPAGDGVLQVNHFRFIEIEPVRLVAGADYVVAGIATGDFGRVVTPGGSMTVNENIELGFWYIDGGPEFEFPGNPIDLGTRFMGADFLFEIAEGCPADFDDTGEVDFLDLLALLFNWGPCGGCSEDIDGDGEVAFNDLLQLLFNWGPCPS